MFSGIVAGVAQISSLEKNQGLFTIGVALPNIENYKLGASVAINGVCLTVTHTQNKTVYFDIMQETLNLTNLVELEVGSLVNFEPSIKLGDEIGGHLLSGHISAQAELKKIDITNNNCQWLLKTNSNVLDYIFPKGFVAIEGASLTVGEVYSDSFNLHLIPETLRTTTFSNLSVGAKLNLEIDSQTQVIVDTIKRLNLHSKSLAG